MEFSPSPSRGQLLLLEDVQGCYPSRGHGAAAAPAFVGIPNSSSSAIGTLVPGTRTLTRRGPSPDRLFADACRAKAPLRSWRSIIPIDLASYENVSNIMLQSIKPRELQRYINLQINRAHIAITSRIQYSL
jgi:hypothetical protein